MKLICIPSNPENHHKVSISSPHDGQTAEDFLRNYVIPIMLGLSYHPDSIRDAFENVEVLGASARDPEPAEQEDDAPGPSPQPPDGYVLIGFNVMETGTGGMRLFDDGDVQFRSDGTRPPDFWHDTPYVDGGGVWYAAKIGSEAHTLFLEGGIR